MFEQKTNIITVFKVRILLIQATEKQQRKSMNHENFTRFRIDDLFTFGERLQQIIMWRYNFLTQQSSSLLYLCF